ncbi:hypothetical protein, partial [Roseofilum sp. Belize Diploria]
RLGDFAIASFHFVPFAMTDLNETVLRYSAKRCIPIAEQRYQNYLEQLTFKYLQEKSGLHEEELEQYFAESHPRKEKLQSWECLELNILQEVVSALGGTLEIKIKIPHKDPLVLIS